MAKTVMAFGVGAVGVYALQFLARSEGVDRIVASDINEGLGISRVNAAASAATCQGFSKRFEFHSNDITDIDATAKLLEEIKPDVVFLSIAIQPAAILRRPPLPQDVCDKFWMAGFATEIPFQLLLPAKFMQAIQKSGIQTHVVNSSFPDVVGPALWKHFGFGPTVGIGNSDLMASSIIKYVSTVEGVPANEVILCFVGSHALAERGRRGEEVPFFLKIQLGDRDITSKYDVTWLTHTRLISVRVGDRDITSKQPTLVRDRESVFLSTASSAVKNIMAILRDTNEYTHAPSPNGLIGGYPVRLSAKGAEVVLPKELTLEQAIKINEDAEKFDGIEKIKDDGTIVYTDKAYSIMKELGYDCKEIPFDELESRSEELERLRKSLQN